MNMIKSIASTGLLLAASFTASTVYASQIDVFQGGVLAGTIESYSGAASADANWTRNYGANVGPTGIEDVGQIFFYDSGVEGLTFNVMWNVDGTSGISNVQWTIDVAGSSSDAYVVEADDNSREFSETATDNTFAGNWRWGGLYDGGIIGGLTGDWEITIDPVAYSNIDGVLAASSVGTTFGLSLDLSQDIVLRASSVSVPEPASALLLGLGLLGFGVVRRKK